MDKEIHDKEHDSKYDPKPDCEFCRYEVFRMTHKCYGNGSSTVPLDLTKDIK